MTAPVHTIGHRGRTPKTFVKALRAAGVDCVVDVRSAPYSKHQPGFRKKRLEAQLRESGIDYVFLGDDLGGRPSDGTCYRGGRIDYGLVARTDFYQRGVRRLRELIHSGRSVCLLCAEAEPWHCHRALLIGRTLHAQGHELRHLLPDGSSLDQPGVLRVVAEGAD
jgi:uncharacterized protein (DUF488 family)